MKQNDIDNLIDDSPMKYSSSNESIEEKDIESDSSDSDLSHRIKVIKEKNK